MSNRTSSDARLSAPSRLIGLLAAAAGLIVANIYYVQPLIGPISAEIGLSSRAAGLAVTLTQLGYAAGLLLVAPLADLMENRRLVVVLTGAAGLAMAAIGLSRGAPVFLAAAAATGVASVAVQVLVPLAAHLSPAAIRGRVVGTVQSGLLIGIMAARPAASFLTQWTGSWRWPFLTAAALMEAMALLLAFSLPARRPEARIGYAAMLASLGRIGVSQPVLWRKALYQFGMFGAFSVFWTTVPLLLAGPPYHFTQNGIAWFALAGIAGAIATPIAGRLADAGWSRAGTGAAIAIVIGALAVSHLARQSPGSGLVLLVVTAILVDFGVQSNLLFGQRAIFLLSAQERARLNGLFIATFFCGGAAGSALGAWAFATDGWAGATWVALGFTAIAVLVYASEWLGPSGNA